ncbi:MAG TPA: Fic/DOC family N-terminal domain-containing protein [Actinomycetota bacterium]|nr:Fic/DOC family N-terminal domain-containing protein [Actinomycetota bacterium]
MDVQRFQKSPAGNLVAISGRDAWGRDYSHFAYLPNPLPDEIPLSGRTWNAIAEASVALGRLDGEGRRLPNPQRLARPAIRAEAVSTSALEGTYTTLPRVMESELMEDDAPSEDREVLDYVRCAEAGFRLVASGKPVSLNMIKQLHGILMSRDPRCPPGEKGEIRSRQNFIGSRANEEITQARYVPPPPGRGLREALQDWEVWVHRRGEVPLLVRVAVGHYQFEALHPFVDGNGRIGRLVAILLLLDEGALSVPLLNISPYLEVRRDAYQDHLLEVSATGSFDTWVRFFAEGIRVQALAGLEKTTRLLALKGHMVRTLRARNVRGLAIQVAEDLIGNPVLTPAVVRDAYEISHQSASSILQTLHDAGLVEPRPWKKNRRYYVAPAVLEVHT